MKRIFNYINRNIIWVIFMSLIFWFASWYLSGFPLSAIIFILLFGFWFIRRCKKEAIHSDLQVFSQPKGFIHNKYVKFILFIFLIFILSGIAKGLALNMFWVFLWISKGSMDIADEIVMENERMISIQADIFVALPVIIILIILYLRYLKQGK